MVMRNRNSSSDSSGWWEDLPPKVRSRISAPTLPDADDSRTHTAVSSLPERRGPSGLDWVREFSRPALLFLAVAVANVLFLLVALSFVASGKMSSPAPLAVP
jgi:hypothetical protein